MLKADWGSLRALKETDAIQYERWINDPDTNQWRGLHLPMTKIEAQVWIEKQMTSSKENFTLAVSVPAAEGEKTIGLIGLRNICYRSRRAELWIYLGDKNYWGKGFGQKAMTRLCQEAFLEMNLIRVWLECDPGHKSAVRCYQNVGFTQEGIMRKGYFRHGEYRDTSIMSFLQDEWFEKYGK
jgi:RimJ/RimL family protein N-acetyltransferase